MRAAALALLLLALPAHGMYKCVDARGVTQYSDKPCPDGKGKEVDIRGQPPISGKVTPGREELNAAERDFQRREAKRERERQADAKADDARLRRCATAQAERQRWASVGRVAVIDGKGERRYLDDSERAAKTAQLDAAIARDCR